MSTKKKILCGLCLLLAVLSLVYVWTSKLVDVDNETVNIEFVLGSETLDEYQLFYSSAAELDEQTFNEEQSYSASLSKTEDDWFSFSIPANTTYVRFDSGEKTKEYYLKSIKVEYNGSYSEISLSDENIWSDQNDIEGLSYNADMKLNVTTDGEDPYLVVSMQKFDIANMIYAYYKVRDLIRRIAATVLILLIAGLLLRYNRILLDEAKDVYCSRKMIFTLSKNDFKNKFSGSYLGVFWAFVQPVVIVTIYWFIFSVGFKSMPVGDCPYLLYLISGICPWFFFNDALNAGTNSLYDYGYIVKKVVFKVDILPIIKIISCAFVHGFFILLVALVFCLHGMFPTWYALQALYYSFCTFMLSLGITYLTSALAVFFKDLSQIVGILLQFGMWMVPIMYAENTFGGNIQRFFKANPIYYVVNGYRDAFISHIGFWEHGFMTIYFWGITIIIFVLGLAVFKKLRPHFADVL